MNSNERKELMLKKINSMNERKAIEKLEELFKQFLYIRFISYEDKNSYYIERFGKFFNEIKKIDSTPDYKASSVNTLDYSWICECLSFIKDGDELLTMVTVDSINLWINIKILNLVKGLEEIVSINKEFVIIKKAMRRLIVFFEEESQYEIHIRNIMNVLELKRMLDEINCPRDSYSILKGGFPNEQYCLTNENDEWEVYYSERGRKSEVKKFENESDACEYFFNKLKKHSQV